MSEGIPRLFITVAISFLVLISIVVASILLPSCVSSEMKSKGNQSEAKGLLFGVSLSQEEYFEKNNCYTTDLEYLINNSFPTRYEYREYYELKIINADCEGYVIRAFGNIDNDPEIDVWEITNESQLGPVNIYDDATNTEMLTDPKQ